ncbi:hypothetical protein DFJ73DRAFT_185004 [Zopfochytrium polystomum]|nr:hypothetical protein DFJ73DRAFT_185004 [Zopfochytrium polystomum]
MSFHHHRHDLGGGVGGRGGVGTSPLSLAPALSRGPSNNSSTLGRGLLSTVRLQSHGNTASATTTTTTTTTIALSNLSSLNASPLASASPPLGSTFRTLHQHLHPHHQQHHHSSRRHHHHPHHHTARQEFPPKPLSILGSRRSGLDVPWPRSADSTRIGHDADSSDDDRIFEPLDESSRHNEPEPPPAYHSVDGGVDHFDNSDDGGGKKQPARTKGTREKRSESRDLSAAAAPRGRGSVDSGKSRKDASSPAADSGAEDGVFAKASPVPVAKVLSPSPSSQTGPSSWSSSSSASGKPLMMPPPSAAPLPGRDQLPKTEHQNPSLTPEIESLWARSQAVLQTLRNHEMERRVNRVIALVDQTADRLRLALLQMYEDMLVLDDSFVLVRERNLDDMLWSVVFYSRIKELKSIIGKFEMDSNPNLSTAVAELNRHLDRAACFYRTLLLVIKSKWNLDPTAAAVGLFHGRDESEFGVPVEMLQRLVSKTVVFLGDIERYRRSHGDAADRSAEQLYMSACRLSPLQGKAFSQLAITSTEREEYFDVVYWYSL